MAREFGRTERVGSQMQRELSTLVRDDLKDPRLGMITIQEVRVTRDFSHAKVFFTAMTGDADKVVVARVMNDSAAFLRHELGHRMKLRTVPQLKFVYDDSIEHGSRLSAMIDEAVELDQTKHQEE
ncbi:Ribosome-binding factor A [hydrothermal vent metagenome]|uniref:Ribosome-binding factor A n=1 Tax=hydrothermal vent metagenome TaxID=652676 RepID=A0A3B1B6R7_9ZZZZ